MTADARRYEPVRDDDELDGLVACPDCRRGTRERVRADGVGVRSRCRTCRGNAGFVLPDVIALDFCSCEKGDPGWVEGLVGLSERTPRK